jgi:fructosamine-3-kinase
MEPWNAICAALGTAAGSPFRMRDRTQLTGGSINHAWRLESNHGRYFVKLNRGDRAAMFAAEAAGLRELAATDTVRVPRPICHGSVPGYAYLVLEYLELSRGGDAAAQQLGHDLARLHAVRGARFGWHRDNTIGSTAQPNGWDDDWPRFWRERRLAHQLRLVAAAGHPVAGGERLLQRVATLLDGHRPQPALLHGDLWGGNWGVLSSGTPVLFDPAVYYGDRETDLAMSELFGGFGSAFYSAYRERAPLDDGYPVRRDLYNLYHVLNHVTLFGGGYVAQAQRLVERLLAA